MVSIRPMAECVPCRAALGTISQRHGTRGDVDEISDVQLSPVRIRSHDGPHLSKTKGFGFLRRIGTGFASTCRGRCKNSDNLIRTRKTGATSTAACLSRSRSSQLLEVQRCLELPH